MTSVIVWIICCVCNATTASYFKIVKNVKCKLSFDDAEDAENVEKISFDMNSSGSKSDCLVLDRRFCSRFRTLSNSSADSKIFCPNSIHNLKERHISWLWAWSAYAFFVPITIISICYGQVLCTISESIQSRNDRATNYSALIKRKAARMVGYLIDTG